MGCSHSSTVTTITAGLAREVCETCGHVSLRYVDTAVRLGSEVESETIGGTNVFAAMVTFEDSSRFRKCKLCAQQAVFMIPEGMMCDEHAWQAAARLKWEDADPWVPIRIDRSNA